VHFCFTKAKPSALPPGSLDTTKESSVLCLPLFFICSKSEQIQTRQAPQFQNPMAPTILFILMTSLFVPAHSHLEPTDQAFTSVVLSRQGLDFLKDLLINKAVSSIIPLKLPKIEKSVRIPFVGSVHMVLSDTTIYKIDVSESYVKPGDAGIVIIVSGATCNLSMNWYYSYSTWLVPVEISDTGSASVQVWLRLLEFVANF
jgi:hypothetical protein